MEIKILAFGMAKEIMGGRYKNISLPENSSVNDLRSLLEQQYPPLKEMASYAIALNKEYVTTNEVIRPSDEIAIIPPVSGG
jgi:molybdopterin synthase sulfur carrier subunit